jgi:dTDP-4-dehydrorhamnose reductase
MARRRGLSGVALKRAALDITDRDAVCDVLDAVRPWAVINAADYARVDAAERDADECGRVNTQGAAILAEECHRRGMRFLALSSDLIFDGHKGAPYVETDEAAPLSVYGRSKANAEREITARCPHALVVRSGPWFGPWDQYNFAIVTLRALAAGRRVHAAGDVRVSPTYLPDLVDAMLDLLIDGECGIWHLANPGVVSWAEFATGIARLAGVPPELVCGVPMHTLRRAAPRPACSALRSDRAQLLPPWEKALERWFVACAGAALARRDPADALPA